MRASIEITPASSPGEAAPEPLSIKARAVPRYRLLDPLRGLAALAVVAFHAFAGWSDTAWAPLAWLGRIAIWGWAGVPVFFAISGWCIAARLYGSEWDANGILKFFRDRFLRVYPVFWAALLFCVFMRMASAAAQHRPWSEMAIPTTARLIAGNILLLQPYLRTSYILDISWTLVYETGFYLIAGTLAFLCRRAGPAALLLGGAALCLFGNSLAAHWLVLGLWPEFFLGGCAFACVLAVQRGINVRVLLAGFAAWSLLVLALDGGSAYCRIAAAAAVAMILLHAFDEKISRQAWLAPLFPAGRASYSIYLFHMPILSAVLNIGKRLVPPTHPAFTLVLVAAFGSAILTGFAAHWAIERRLEQWRKSLRWHL